MYAERCRDETVNLCAPGRTDGITLIDTRRPAQMGDKE